MAAGVIRTHAEQNEQDKRDGLAEDCVKIQDNASI